MFGLHWLDLTTLLVYLLGVTVAGLWAARKVTNLHDYFMGSRKFGKAFMVMHAFGTGTHTDHAVTVAGASYRMGMAGIWYQWLYLFATPFYWLVAPLLRRMRYLTTADYFEDRFSPALAILYTIYGLLYLSLQIGLMLLGTGKAASAISGGAISPELAIGVMTILFLSYGLLGGLPAAVVTDFIQGFFIIVLSFLLIPFVMEAVGGFAGLHQKVPEEMFSLMAPGDPPAGYDRVTPFYIVMIVINALVGIVAQPHHMEIAGAGKTELEGRIGFTFGNMLKRICTLAWALTGVACIALYPDLADSEHAFGLASRDLLPVGLVGVMLASMVAAAMSSCDSLMVDGSALFVKNVYQRYLRPEASVRHYLNVGRLVGVAVVMGGIVVATYATTVVGILKLTWSLVAFFGIAFWGGVLWRRCNAYGAWAGILGSSLLWYLSRFVWGWELHQQFLIYLVGGFFCMIVVSLLTPPADRKRLDRFYAILHTPIGEEHRLRAAGIRLDRK
jgi:Na+/proline symporter